MALQDQEQLCSILITLLDQIVPVLPQVEYRLVGTGASLLHGVQTMTKDVDLLVKDRDTVDRFGTAMCRHFRCLIPSTYLTDARQYFSSYEVAGIEVEISTVEWETESDGIECLGRGPWEHFQWLPCGIYTVPTVALELRLVSELARGRDDRYNPLIQHMQQHGCNLELVKRGMEAHGMAAEIQSSVVRQLKVAR
jgi:hypothetical protein